MRALAFSLLFACAPKVTTTGGGFNEDLRAEPVAREQQPSDERAKLEISTTPPPAIAAQPACGTAPAHGVRTGTIDRAHLVEVLDKGPGMFLRQFEVAPRLDGNRFVGWQLVQLLDPTGPLASLDVAPCDVLFAINGKPLSRPDQLQDIWDSLRKSDELVAQLWRGGNKLELRFAIEPKLR
jgi:hypothetical protein